MKKTIVILLLAVFANALAVFAADINIKTLHQLYPHWDLSNPATVTKLDQIESFIQKNKNSGNLAVFDWDGTLYNENIPVPAKDLKDFKVTNYKFAGQPAWYIWAANHDTDATDNVFPMFDTEKGQFVKDVLRKDLYLEGRIKIQSQNGADIYSKFIQTSIFTAGMTPQNIVDSVNKYLAVPAYSPDHNAFMPMLDVLQRMCDSGFDVWIVTGSNPYFVSVIIKYIEQDNNMLYQGKHYNFGPYLSTIPYNSATGHIAGNGLKLLENGTFSVSYNNHYLADNDGILYIVDHEGKCIAMNNIKAQDHNTPIFVAGNSDGDYDDTNTVVANPYHLAIAVDPAVGSQLAKLAGVHANIVALTKHEAAPNLV